MKRDYRFDIARVLCMTYIVAFVHLWAYVHPEVISACYVHPLFSILTNCCLGIFTFASGYLLGSKYSFGKYGNTKMWSFYKKRVLRIIPLFLLASIILYLIGFNGAKATLNGVLYISPFVKPRPLTLWYIPVILWCYFITPLVCRKKLTWRLISGGGGILLIMCVLRRIYPSIDWRFQFNMLFYLVGLVSAPYFDWKFQKMPFIKWLVVVLFIGLLVISRFTTLNVYYKLCGLGVFAILFICEGIAKVLFNKENAMAQLTISISYASMACYMFHRLFFWGGELLWNPSIHWVKWGYMAGIVFPLMIVLSYYIQKGYDLMVERMIHSESFSHDSNYFRKKHD